MEHSQEIFAKENGFARVQVPVEARGPAYPIFLIVAGALCGLPVLILSSQVGKELGLLGAVVAFIVGGAISGVLGALNSYCGARSGLSLALISEQTFGRLGGIVLKLTIALCTLGWFAVICAVMGATAAGILHQAWQINVAPAFLVGALIVVVGLLTLRGVKGLSWIGTIILPLTALLLAYAIYHTLPFHLTVRDTIIPSFGAAFSNAVSGVVGMYIVGVIIQPDFGRFVKIPSRAAFASGSALSIFYPLMLIASAIPSIAVGATDLISVLVGLGLAAPAFALLLITATIDSSVSLYSSSLGFTNLLKIVRLRWVIVAACVCAFWVTGVDAVALLAGFLTTLGIALPPVAAINIISALQRSIQDATRDVKTDLPLIRIGPCIAWVVGVAGGYAASVHWITLTTVASLDSILFATITLAILRLGGKMVRQVAPG